MANYEKPVIIDTEEHYEGVYAASGDNTDSGVSAPKCDSKYMNGVWHEMCIRDRSCICR